MERITIFVRTTKKEGQIKLRFRLTDGRRADLYHKSDIRADLCDLERLDEYGKPKKGIRIYNETLSDEILAETAAMHRAYTSLRERGAIINAKTFEDEICRILHPEQYGNLLKDSLLNRFEKYIEDNYKDGIIGKRRYDAYNVVFGNLQRFLTINRLRDIKPREVDADMVMAFRQFLFDEYLYVSEWPGLYTGMNDRELPKARRSQNTISTKLKAFQAFLRTLEDAEEIDKNPFRQLGRERKKSVMRVQWDEPFSLTLAELEGVRTASIPAELEETRRAFLLQSAIGCRIGDFQRLTMENVSVENGIPYVHYLPEKTAKTQKDNSEVKTPLVRYALELVKQDAFNYPITRYPSGQDGYNARIKKLLEACGVDRRVPIFNEETQRNEQLRICDVASSKLARKTNVDLLKECQVNFYAGGLHKEGSEAVHHYSKLTLQDRFILLSAAFNQEQYKVNSNLELI